MTRGQKRPFKAAYDDASAVHGYWNNPHEISARTSSHLATMPKTPGLTRGQRLKEADFMARGDRPEQHFAKLLGDDRAFAKETFHDAAEQLLARFGTSRAPTLDELNELIRIAPPRLSPLEQTAMNKLKLRQKMLSRRPE